MEYAALVDIYERLSGTTRRLEKTEYLAEFLKKVPAHETEQVVLLLQGLVYPSWQGLDLGVASQLMVKAIALACGASTSSVEQKWKETGDLGDVAQQLIKHKRQHTLFQAPLTVAKVFSNLRKLATMSGAGSVERKLQLIAELLSLAKDAEARYISRTILGDLRIGLGEGTLRDAIVWAYFMTVDEDMGKEKRTRYNEYAALVQQAYDLTNDFAFVAKVAREQGEEGLQSVPLTIGKPIKMMLALKVDSLQEAFATVGRPAGAEFKYDGFRMEICKDEQGTITLFTRRLENVTTQFPDVVAAVQKHVKAKSFILDAEVVGYDPATRKYLPFQNISQRIKRKHEIDRMAQELPVEVNVFDMLAYNGKNMIAEPFAKRRAIIERIVEKKERLIRPSEAIITGKEEEVEAFFELSKSQGNEGLMIKNLEAPYQPGARVGYMLKYKKVMENLDLVVVEAEWGEGKRSAWLSSYTLACRNGEKLLEIGKAATGLKEKPEEGLSFEEMTTLLRPLIIKEDGKQVTVTPEVVLEVAYEEIQKSPSYGSGYALRFPRVIRNRTSEKSVQDINRLEDVERLYEQQEKVKRPKI